MPPCFRLVDRKRRCYHRGGDEGSPVVASTASILTQGDLPDPPLELRLACSSRRRTQQLPLSMCKPFLTRKALP